ncbi:hypothetical protein [Bradyrhizobium sp. SYSU BS000235]|uniref:hypothetical protein n=1 Tax=Bradyrhizobium sp. SYSU BS000235 TaxID=3411332 RepID=UPI003C77AB85
MFGPKILSFRKGMVLTTVAALSLSLAVPPSAVQARTAAPAVKDVSASTAVVGEATDFSARRRVARRHYRHNNAAGLAFMGLALGAIGTAIADQRRRDYYRQHYFYGGTPYYGGHYYGAPAYYGYGVPPYDGDGYWDY